MLNYLDDRLFDRNKNMISSRPKKIHYCWFGSSPLPELALKCIESWKKYCPDYEIIEWNESNFDVHCCRYVEEAYNAKKWAFVSDYARFWILYHYGGVYFDTDVELIKSIDDLPDTFAGFESDTTVASGLIRGATKGDSVCKMMIDSYQNDRFLLDGDSFNFKTVCERETHILEKNGLRKNGQLQIVANTVVYPRDYFCPKDFATGVLNITENTYAIHHYDGSWLPEEEKYYLKLYSNYRQKHYSKLFAKLFARMKSTIKYRGVRGLLRKIFSKK